MKINGKIKAKGARFVRFYPSDWRSGCLGLSLEQQGLYVAICVFQWETGRRLFSDDTQAAHALGLNPKNYRKVRNELVERGKLTLHENGYANVRAETELNAALGAGSASRRQGEAEQLEASRIVSNQHKNRGNPLPERYAGTNAIVNQSSINPGLIVDQSSILVEKINENQSRSIEPIANSREPKKEDPKPQFAQSDMPSHVKPIANWSAAFSQSVENHETVIRATTGEILLLNGTRQTWLEKFGGDGERLDLALIEIAGDINEHSRKPLAADVQGRLARKAGDKLDRDQRYRAAVAANATAKAAPKPVKLSRWG